jgi:hypothetical protein
MQSRRFGLLLAAVAVVVAVVLFVVLQDNGSDSGSATTPTHATNDENGKPAPSVPTIVVRNAKPVGGVQDLSFNHGDDIQFRVKSDVSDEVHFHGYDVGKDVEAGGSVEFNVPATIEGVFEVELESRAEQLASITVNP